MYIETEQVLKWNLPEEEWSSFDGAKLIKACEALEKVLDNEEGWNFETTEERFPHVKKDNCFITVELNPHGNIEYGFFTMYEGGDYDAWFTANVNSVKTLSDMFTANAN